MVITDELIAKLADLSKLEFDQRTGEEIKKDLERILSFVEKLSEVNTENTGPLLFLTEEIPLLREDIDKKTITREEALKNSPQKDMEYFKMPKVVEKK